MKLVYIVVYNDRYDGQEILCVFDVHEKAHEYINNRIKNSHLYGEYGLISTELGKDIDTIDVQWFPVNSVYHK